MSAEGYLVAGRYRIGARVGSGAMGIVWQAQDERLGRVVAVKQLLVQNGLSPDEAEESKQRIMREGRIAARLHHQNAVAIYDVVDDAGSPCLVMEYLPSRSLDDVLHEEGALPPHEVGRIGAGVAAALAAAHSAGIVHRDIKPANVLLGEHGVVKITDFGISRATDDVTVTKTGLIAGTPAYLAPEVAVGREPRPPSDVFSLGSTLYAAVEGEPPFGLSENTLGLLHAVAAARVNPPRQAGPMTDVLLSLLRAEPEDRPDARQAAGMLDAVARGQPPRVPPGAAAPTVLNSEAPTRALGQRPTGTATQLAPAGAPAKRGRKRALLIAAAVLAVIAAIVLVLLLTNVFGGNNPQAPPAPSSRTSTPPSTTSSVTETPTTEPTVDTPTEEAPPPQQPPPQQPPPERPPPDTPDPPSSEVPSDDQPPDDPPDDGGGNGGGGGGGNGGGGNNGGGGGGGGGVELPIPVPGGQ